MVLERVEKMKKLLLLILISILLTGCDKVNIYSLVDEKTKEIYEINEKVFCNDIEFAVTNIQEKTNKEDVGINPNEKLVAVTYKIKNNTKEEKVFFSSDFKIINQDGELIKSTVGVFTSMWEGKFLKSPKLVPGGEKEGYLVYVLDKDDNEYTIQYTCVSNFLEDDGIIKVNPR